MNMRTVLCLECNEPVGETTRAEKRFCCNAHKDRYNNRRKNRGAELYDIFMGMRFDRKAASEAGAWAVMCRMASNWKTEDDEAGVRSFQPVKEVMMRMPQHVAVRGRVSKSRT